MHTPIDVNSKQVRPTVKSQY